MFTVLHPASSQEHELRGRLGAVQALHGKVCREIQGCYKPLKSRDRVFASDQLAEGFFVVDLTMARLEEYSQRPESLHHLESIATLRSIVLRSQALLRNIRSRFLQISELGDVVSAISLLDAAYHELVPSIDRWIETLRPHTPPLAPRPAGRIAA